MSKQYNTKLQERLEKFLKDENLSQAKAAPILGISQAALSQYRRSMYDKGDIEAVENKLKEFFQIQEEKTQNAQKAEPFRTKTSAGYIPTTISEEAYKLIRYCQLEKGIVVIDGDAGIGKTKAAAKFLQDNPSTTVYVKATPSTGSTRSLLKMIAKTLKLPENQRTEDLSVSIQEKLRETVITEIDAYNKVQSNTANYFQYNDDAILKVLKLGDVSSQDIADMKEKGAIILEDGGDVDWLLKTIDDTALENYKNRLREDIHTGANVPHMCDESFGGNLSGVAISYKLWGLEQICSIKERKFKKGLQRRIELITNILNIMGHNYDYRDIAPKFRRNRPQNDMETAQIVTMLANDLSRETRLQLMPGVENVQDELRKLEEEKNKEQEDFGVYKNFTKAFQGAADRTEAVTDEPEGT